MSATTLTALVGGSIIDGTGSPAFPGTVVLAGDTIVDVLPPGNHLSSDVTAVNCTGQVVAPGFIDSHSHADNAPLLSDADTSKIEQGVTTEVTGNCGFSLAPVEPVHAAGTAALLNRIFPPLGLDWTDTRTYLQTLADSGLVTNQAPLVGHNSLRIAAMGLSGRPAEPDEQKRMSSLLDSALEAGAFGLSSGLIYPPGVFSDADEIRELVQRLGGERIYATHMRNESLHVFDSIEESLNAVAGGTRLHISHVKLAAKSHWGRMGELLAHLNRARERGVRVSHDVYPYAAGSTMLSAILPPWFQDGGTTGVLARLGSRDSLAQAERDIASDTSYENIVAGAGWDRIVVSSTASHRYEGKSIATIASALGVSPFDAVVDVLREEHLQATMVAHYMNEDDVRTAIAEPSTAIGSDGLPPGTGGKPHPRTFGTFPRVLGHYARTERVLSLESAVHKMTGLTADIFGLADRGRLRRGGSADIVVFDPRTVMDTATYADPETRPVGIDRVYQNGSLVVDGGAWLGTRRGRVLTPA